MRVLKPFFYHDHMQKMMPTNKNRPLPGELFLLGFLGLCILIFPHTRTAWSQEEPSAEKKTATKAKSELDQPVTDVKDKQETDEKKVAAVEEEQKPKIIPPELQPYRVHVSVAFSTNPNFDQAFRTRFLQELADACQRSLGEMWTVHIEENQWLFPTNREGLDRLTAEEMQQRYAPAEFDKVFLLTANLTGVRYQLSGREWDAESNQLTLRQNVETSDRRLVAEHAFGLLNSLFQPTAILESSDMQSAELIVRAGEFPAPDPTSQQFLADDLLLPFFQYYNREKVLLKIQFLPWSYLQVTEVNRQRLNCSTYSALRVAFGGKSRRRVSAKAHRVRAPLKSTDVKFVLQSNTEKPLSGYNVTIVNYPPARNLAEKAAREKQGMPEPLRIMTDRQGTITLPTDPAHPLFWIYVRSGKSLLARVPFAPGLNSHVTVELPDDSLRLGVEGELFMLQGDLIALVAERAVLMNQARRLAGLGDYTKSDVLAAQLKELNDAEYFSGKLRTIRVDAVEAAKARRDFRSQTRVLAMCEELSALIFRYLDETKIRDLDDEIKELKRINPR